MPLPLPAKHTAPATTSEQFAVAMRNRALFNLNADLREVPHVDEATPGALVIDQQVAAFERCLAELERADTFAPDMPAPAELIVKLRRWRLVVPTPEWRLDA